MGKKILIKPPKKEEINNLYWKKELSQNEIAKIYNVARYTVQRWMWAYNIPRRPDGFTTKRMRKEMGLRRRGMRNSPGTEFKQKINISKKKLEQLYLKEKLSMKKIGRNYSLYRNSIKSRLKKYNIPIRSTREEYEKLRLKNLKDYMNQPEIKKLYCERAKKNFNNPESRKKSLKALMKRPTRPEQRFIDITKKYNLPYKYVGDGEFILGGKCPDFLNCNGEKKVVEIFGRVFHDPEKAFKKIPYHQTKKGTIEHYEKYGFKCLVIWEDEFKNKKQILDRLGGFK